MASDSVPAILGILLLCACLVQFTSGHGRLRSPPGRSSMWRDGFPTAKNYQDNELFCGGRWYQWEVNGGKCGVCGDPWGKPQHNQPPGKYARPILAKCYQYGTKYIDAHVELTANHLGHMQFRLCGNNDFNKPVSQECLDQHLLDISNENGKLIGKTLKVRSRTSDFFLRLTIPENLTCSQCVLQWKYVTANSWGCAMVDTRRRCAMGLGGQESFWACSDIAIVPDCKNPKNYAVSDSYKSQVPQEGTMEEIKDKAERQKPILVIDDEDLPLSALVDGKLFGAGKRQKSEGTDTAETQESEDDTQRTGDKVQEGTHENGGTATGEDGRTSSNGATQFRQSGGGSKDPNRPSKDNSDKKSPGGSNSGSRSRAGGSEARNAGGSNDGRSGKDGGADRRPRVTRAPPRVITRAPRKLLRCIAVGLWSGQPHMAIWCQYNCLSGFCPRTMCYCTK